MSVRVAFLRGVNVGGNKKVSMAALKAALEAAGFTPVKTHLNSGNVVFEAGDLPDTEAAQAVAEAVSASAGVGCAVMVRSAAALKAALAADPFPETDGARMQLTFLEGAPAPGGVEALQALIAGPERLSLGEGVLYGAFPDGISASALFKADWRRRIGVEHTARNRNTVQALVTIADGLAG